MSARFLYLALVSTLLTAACGKSAATKMCLKDTAALDKAMADKSEEARQLAGQSYQACGIACDVTKDEDACKAFEKVTGIVCEKEGKEACAKLCKADKGNAHACSLAETM